MLCALLLSLTLVNCSNQDESGIESRSARDTIPLTIKEIDSRINKVLDSQTLYNWKRSDDHMIWSAGYHGNFLFTIGFGNSAADFDRSKFPQHMQLQNQLLLKISEMEQRPIADILVQSENYLCQIDVIIKKESTVAALRRMAGIRYIEPADYSFTGLMAQNRSTLSSSSSSGCGYTTAILPIADYSVTAPNAKVPWSFTSVQIPQAWNLSSGSGITVGVIDTGVSSEQSLLGSSFADGYSSNRSISKFGFYVDSIWPWSTTTDGSSDLCGHGTSMVSTISAPRNDNAMPTGVAYNCNIISCRAASNVLLDGYHEQNGVKNAFTYLANMASVRIISMSMGHIITVSKIEDAVKYAYSKNKLIFCAAGTSTSYTNFVGVIFPASMTETVAVTGVKEGIYQACSDCHSGSKVEFTTPMERSVSDNHVPVNSYYNNASDYIGGSSVATATVAGIATLVWARYPTWTRAQVLTRMRSSGNFYPVKHTQFGYGNINANLAVQ
ncbi:S8/S53 family peptidase [Flavobacterium sp. SE-s28]|uniref:S8/S53 family peptidase n=2 Tax=Flavobacterium silvaticum TaxID=1852020 RepID=A0A972FNU5_9FLAO|nr:S8/S53 family peptidase [Flavobacterium silvaticum]